MAEFAIKIQGMDRIAKQFSQAPKTVEPILQKAIVGTQFILQKHNLKGDPTPWRTGNLLQLFRFQTGRLFARYFPTAKYALSVNDGTGPFEIKPKNKKALYWQGASHPVKKVKHPGLKGQHYMEKIRDKAQSDIDTFMLEAAEMIGQELTK